MYNITELDSMDDSQLKNVAESMGIKNINPDNRQELIFSILDQQAIDKAAADAAKPMKKRRGRAPKEAEETRTQEPTPEPEAVQETPAPKKRGRKKKSEANAENPVAPEDVTVAMPEVEKQVAPEAPAPKKRGRKKKTEKVDEAEPVAAQSVEAPAVAPDTAVLSPVDNNDNNNAAPEPAVNEEKQEPGVDN
ncbi:MAG: Rho termination factor N-terminal domain-containing protein, partial [Muribaculaceae bacterium]|nr:Rho termination factor N-terminal domain-containing protein [Muribaculaceae bacterium]